MKKVVLCNISCVLGNGESIRFWTDSWTGNQRLKDLFPNIYRLSLAKDITVANCYTGNIGSQAWSITCRRNLNDWEISEYVDLLLLIQPYRPSPPEVDSFSWNLEKSSKFSVRSLYNTLLNNNYDSDSCIPYSFWKYPVPPKFSAFGWLVSKKKILTIDNLRRRGMLLPNICLCCMRDEESVNHLLLHCPFISEIWSDFLPRFNMSWCFPSSVDLLLFQWNGVACGKTNTRIWRMSILAIWWSVWEERNGRCFRDLSNSAQRVSSRAKRSIIEWASIDDILKDCDLSFLTL